MLSAIFATLFGLATGSFLSVCIYRIPRSREDFPELLLPIDGSAPPEESLADGPPHQVIQIHNPPRSFCPSCNQTLRWWHNIPLLSWLFLRGRCGFCRAPISVRYPLVEFLGGLTAYLSVTIFGVTPTAALIFIFCCALIVISFIDYDFYIIPNVISLPGTVLGVGIAVVNQYLHIFSYPVVPGLLDSVWGLLAGAGFLYLVSEGYMRLRKREGLGMGDVKLLAMTGVVFGAPGALFTIFIGSLLGAVIGILFVVCGGRRFSHPLPFGPSLALATYLYIFLGGDALGFLNGGHVVPPLM